MSTAEGASGEARVRWLIVGAFTPSPAGKRFKVTPDSFAQIMADSGLTARATVKDRFGAGDTRAFEITFNKPRSFQLAELVASVPELKVLRALAEDLGSSDMSKRPSTDAALARLREAVGTGKLDTAVETALRGAPPAAVAAATPSADTATGNVDAIFGQADVSKGTTPKSAVDAFVKAGRSGSSTGAASSAGAKNAKNAIDEAVFGTASDILRDSAVARIEAAWRGLKLVVDHCTSSGGMSVEIADVNADGVVGAIEYALVDDAIDHPDAMFVIDGTDDLARLAALAEVGERANAPVIVAAPATLFGTNDPAAVSVKIEDDKGGLPEGWAELRANEASRWLCVVTNRVVLTTEGTGAARRTCFGSPVFAMAAMLAASFRYTGSFARIFGGNGALKAPGTWELPSGRDAGTAVPTEAFFSLRTQSRLSALGIIGLGSGKNTDTIAMTTAPTTRGGEDLVPLPAQILTGRIVRFAQWVRDSVPQGSLDKDILTMFEQAAGVFLFPGSTEGAGLKAQIIDNKTGGKGVLLTASVKAEHAGIPFHLAFTLPISN